MYKFIIFVLCVSVFVNGIGIFHVKSKMVFKPDDFYDSGYFGYSVFLYRYGLIVGAPKSKSKETPSITPGVVFNCSYAVLDKPSVTCLPMGANDTDYLKNKIRRILVHDLMKDDMWFGATMAPLSDGKILICAPRWALPYKDKHLLANGACYLRKQDRDSALLPLREPNRQAFITDGKRKEFGEYGTHLNFYAYGQVGMSMKVTTNNTVIIGAPGLLQWTGGIVNFKFNPDELSAFISKQPTTNPYFTKELVPDDYFGYSVESGTFEKNGQVLYVGGAPRALIGYGQVLIFEPAIREQDALKVRAKLKGPQLGGYFGATLCCMDIDGDGRTDLLVGAPTYVKINAGLPYDQGAVFVYMSKEKDDGFLLEESGVILGSGESGAKFGTSIADMGDLDGDGYRDVAISAPWENLGGTGVVYIYRGNNAGLDSKYVQRIVAEEARGFGISISKGYDVDNNNCNDLVIGAYDTGRAYLYRCIPTMQIRASIKVPDALNIPQNASGFSVLFCVNAPSRPLWKHVKLDLKARIILDPEQNRAQVSGDSEYNVTIKPGSDNCNEQNVEIRPTADLSRPISIKIELEPVELFENSSKFPSDAARISEDSELNSSFLVQIIRDCGHDLICTPWLIMTLEALNNPYIPGAGMKFGAKLTVHNEEEPAYGARVNITLPSTPIRVPGDCSLQDLNMTCIVPAPLARDEEVTWELELEYGFKDAGDLQFKIVAVLEDSLYRNITDEEVKELVINVAPEANFSVNAKALPNTTLAVTREKFNEKDNLTFVHYFEITNSGPSNWDDLKAEIIFSDKVKILSTLKDCSEGYFNMTCFWSIPAKVSIPVIIQLRFDLGGNGDLLQINNTLNITTKIILTTRDQYIWTTVTTTLILDPAPPIWPLVVGLIAGLLVLAIIISILYKYGFFSRTQHEKLKELKEQDNQEEPSTSLSAEHHVADESTVELICDESE